MQAAQRLVPQRAGLLDVIGLQFGQSRLHRGDALQHARRRGEAAAQVGIARAVVEREVVAEHVVELRADIFLVGRNAVDRHALEHAFAVENELALVEDRVIGLAAAVKTREGPDVVDARAVEVGQRRCTGIVDALGIGDLEIEPQERFAVGEILGEVALDLDTVVDRVADPELVFAALEEAAASDRDSLVRQAAQDALAAMKKQ